MLQYNITEVIIHKTTAEQKLFKPQPYKSEVATTGCYLEKGTCSCAVYQTCSIFQLILPIASDVISLPYLCYLAGEVKQCIYEVKAYSANKAHDYIRADIMFLDIIHRPVSI
jgi:hypothetical protein